MPVMKPWIVFGLDGRTEQDVRSAVEMGYRKFDTAEAYGDTTDYLAGAIKASGRPRADFDVLYKFDVGRNEKPAELRDRLVGVADAFGGKLDAALIHNLSEDREHIPGAWAVLQTLKKQGVIGKAGVGNVQDGDGPLLSSLRADVIDTSPHPSRTGSRAASDHGSREQSPAGSRIDVFQEPADRVLRSEPLQQALQKYDAELYYFHVVTTLADVNAFQARDPDTPAVDMLSTDGMTALAQQVGFRGPGETAMVVSSGDPDRQRQNLAKFTADPTEAAEYPMAHHRAIDRWREAATVCRTNDASFSLEPQLKGKLTEIFENSADLRRQIDRDTGGQVTGRSVSAWLVEHKGLAMEDLQAIRVPARVGLKSEYVDMPLGTVLGNQLGAQNCNYKWSNELSAALLLPPTEWNAVSSNLTNIAVPRTAGVAALRSDPHAAAGSGQLPPPARGHATPPRRSASPGR